MLGRTRKCMRRPRNCLASIQKSTFSVWLVLSSACIGHHIAHSGESLANLTPLPAAWSNACNRAIVFKIHSAVVDHGHYNPLTASCHRRNALQTQSNRTIESHRLDVHCERIHPRMVYKSGACVYHRETMSPVGIGSRLDCAHGVE